MSVTAVGVPPLAYQWTSNGFVLSGQTGASLVLSNVTMAADDASYGVVVTNAYGSVTSSPVPISVIAEAPFIVQQPVPITRWVGGAPGLFTVVAGGS